jgi:hypothetical protein
MNKTIWKFAFPIVGQFTLDLPRGARVLHTELQQGQATLWAEVDPDAPTVPFHFAIVATGGPIPPGDVRYIGTFQAPPFVWHLYQV